MKTIARKHYQQVDGALTEDNALELQKHGAKKKCLVVSDTDRPLLALAQVAKAVWGYKLEDSVVNAKGYNTISFTRSLGMLKNGYFDLLFSEKALDIAHACKVKKGGIIFTLAEDGSLIKTIQEA